MDVLNSTTFIRGSGYSAPYREIDKYTLNKNLANIREQENLNLCISTVSVIYVSLDSCAEYEDYI